MKLDFSDKKQFLAKIRKMASQKKLVRKFCYKKLF
mgnify:CR=1 FL=1|jgi:hypothetical protein